MRLSYLLPCEYASALATGAPLIVGAFREVLIDPRHLRLEPFFVGLELEADPIEAGIHALELRVIDADGADIYREELHVEFRARPDYGPSYAFLPLRVAIRGEVAPGPYRLDLVLRGEPLGSRRVDVRLAQFEG